MKLICNRMKCSMKINSMQYVLMHCTSWKHCVHRKSTALAVYLILLPATVYSVISKYNNCNV